MQRILCILSVVLIVLLSGCEKDQSIVPNEKTLIKSEKGLLCRGCGDWDLADPSATPQASTFRIVATDTVPAVKKSEGKESRDKKSDREENESRDKSSDREENESRDK
jgi:hypothetical protein